MKDGKHYKLTQDYTTTNQYWNNPDMKVKGFVIHSVGVPQPRTGPIIKWFKKSDLRASVHACIEPGLVVETLETRKAPGVAKLGYHVGVGSKGSYNYSHLGFEMCEPSTIRYVNGFQVRDLDPKASKEYFMAVTKTTAEYVADLCIYHNLPVTSITTHWQAHLAGYGCNHQDPDHLWRLYGYSLEQFRADVQKFINEKKEGEIDMTKEELIELLDERIRSSKTTYRTLADVPNWAKPIVQRLVEEGVITGTGTAENGEKILNISGDLLRAIVIMDRMQK